LLNSKHQIPNSKQKLKSKKTNPKLFGILIFQDLNLFGAWNLFGIWNFLYPRSSAASASSACHLKVGILILSLLNFFSLTV